jgi:hypothetical protein
MKLGAPISQIHPLRTNDLRHFQGSFSVGGKRVMNVEIRTTTPNFAVESLHRW